MLMQDEKIVSTFSRKLNEAQLKYTVTGQELLACVEACKHFDQIICGCEIKIFTDHQNLTNSEHQFFLMLNTSPSSSMSKARMTQARTVSVDYRWMTKYRQQV